MMQGRGGYRPAYQRTGDGVPRSRQRELRLRGEEAGRRLSQENRLRHEEAPVDGALRSEASVLSIVIGVLALAMLFNAIVEAMFR